MTDSRRATRNKRGRGNRDLLAEQGDAEAQCNLGETYYFGKGVLQDYKEAAEWFRKAAEQGHAHAQYWLGFMYSVYYSEGVSYDYKEAAEWFRKAAEQGDAEAQLEVGYMYYFGHGVSQDYKEAAEWFRKAG